MRVFVVLLFCALAFTHGQISITQLQPIYNQNGFSDKMFNVSLEILYHTSKFNQDENLIMSPITAWTVMAVIAEGASGNTLNELRIGFRLHGNHTITRINFQKMLQWLLVNTSTIELARFNGLYIDSKKQPERDFRDIARLYYNTELIELNFTNPVAAANEINHNISRITHGRIPTLVDSSDLVENHMLLTSALYFKGQWASPFNTTSTVKRAFYNSNGEKIGDVNMMYNRYTYPFSNIKDLNARVIELPYGKENRLSMLIMLPNPGVALEDVFLNFKKLPLESVFKELKTAQEQYGEDEVDCFIPRFKIESNLMLTNVMKRLGIYDLFDESRARLTRMARFPIYVSKIIHKAEIEVTEEGTIASGVTAAEFANRIGVVRFEANRPFTYLIIEKLTNTVVFGGIYQKPTIY